jgi:hypothetical protein
MNALATDPAHALDVLAAELRQEGPEVADHVASTGEEPVLGMLVAAGPRCAAAPGEYAAVVESIREGWLLHYGEPRLLAADDPDLRLLVGDHLYARGIERLVQLEDLLAVGELSDLISLSAQLDAAAEDTADASAILWLAACVAIAAGPGETHERNKAALRESGDPEPLLRGARESAEGAGLSEALAGAFEAVGSPAPDRG